jgi:hypothetical protein
MPPLVIDEDRNCRAPPDVMLPLVMTQLPMNRLSALVTEPPIFNCWRLFVVPAANTKELPLIVTALLVAPRERQPEIVTLWLMVGNGESRTMVYAP